MATQEEAQTELEERAKAMDGLNVVDAVKIEIASAAMVLECCFLAAHDLIKRLHLASTVVGFGEEAARGQVQKEIALELFDAVVRRSVAQQQAPPISIANLPEDLIRL